jgi:hypothetical protein
MKDVNWKAYYLFFLPGLGLLLFFGAFALIDMRVVSRQFDSAYRLAVAGSTLCLVCFAMTLYIIRRSMRLLYGCIEVAASIGIIVMSIPAAVQLLDRQIPSGQAVIVPWENGLAAFGLVAASVYVLVRGLDNVGEGLKQYPRWEAVWDFVFPKTLKKQ